MLAQENGGKMTLESGSAGKGLLRKSRIFEQTVEELAVLHNRGKQTHGQRIAFFRRKPTANFPDQTGEVDTARTDVLAGFTTDAVLAENFRLVMTMEEVRQDQAYGSDVDIAHLVPAYQTEHGADIGAGSAAYAAEYLGEKRILGYFTATVVHEDHMHDLSAVGVGLAFAGTVHERDIGGQTLGSGVAG